MDYINAITGFILGCAASGLVSLFWYKVLVPKVTFADTICRYDSTSENEVYTYKIKFRNSGKRDIFEMYLYCSIFFPGLQLNNNIHTTGINLSYNFKPLFKKYTDKTHTNPDGLVRICLNDEDMMMEFKRPIYPEAIRQKAESRTLTLEDLLSIVPSSHMKFYIIAHDRFTGSKKIFESPSYTIDNIKHGFYKYGELSVIERLNIPVRQSHLSGQA